MWVAALVLVAVVVVLVVGLGGGLADGMQWGWKYHQARGRFMSRRRGVPGSMVLWQWRHFGGRCLGEMVSWKLGVGGGGGCGCG